MQEMKWSGMQEMSGKGLERNQGLERDRQRSKRGKKKGEAVDERRNAIISLICESNGTFLLCVDSSVFSIRHSLQKTTVHSL